MIQIGNWKYVLLMRPVELRVKSWWNYMKTPILTYKNSHKALCGPVRVKVGVKDNQTTNTQVTAIMRDVGLRNYGEFNEPVFCNKAVLWAVDENGWALLACRSV